MNERFHTEDCGVSLLCRCCRAPACSRWMAKAERIDKPQTLWPLPRHPNRPALAGRLRGYDFARCFARWMATARGCVKFKPATHTSVEGRMKTIGIVGGMSWESSAEYYRRLNQSIKAKLGPTHSAQILMYSVDFHPVARLELEERWDELAAILIDAADRLARAGADFVVLASNTAHRVAERVEPSIPRPLLHIADATADAIADAGINTVGLLGTRFVMNNGFYQARLSAKNINVLVPDHAGQVCVHDIIYDELCAGKFLANSKEKLLGIIENLRQKGAEAVVLACTELPLLIYSEDTRVRLFDTLALHVEKAVDRALA